MPDVVNIAEEREKYRDEWLLFEVVELDERQWPVRGRLLCHSKSRDEIHGVAMQHRDRELQTLYTGDLVPDDAYVVL